jgi:hypothetical protein
MNQPLEDQEFVERIATFKPASTQLDLSVLDAMAESVESVDRQGVPSRRSMSRSDQRAATLRVASLAWSLGLAMGIAAMLFVPRDDRSGNSNDRTDSAAGLTMQQKSVPAQTREDATSRPDEVELTQAPVRVVGRRDDPLAQLLLMEPEFGLATKLTARGMLRVVPNPGWTDDSESAASDTTDTMIPDPVEQENRFRQRQWQRELTESTDWFL